MSTTNRGSDAGSLGAGVGRLFEGAPWAYLAQLLKRTRDVLGRELLRQRLMDLLQAEQLADYVGPSPAEIGEIDHLLHALADPDEEESAPGPTPGWPGPGAERAEEESGQANGSGEHAERPRELV